MGIVVARVPCYHSKLELEPDWQTTFPRRRPEKAWEVALHVAQGSPVFVVSCARTWGDSPLFWARFEIGKVRPAASSLEESCAEAQFGEKPELNSLHLWLIWTGDGGGFLVRRKDTQWKALVVSPLK